MNPKILYCGDSEIGGPANYLLAILSRIKQSFQHIAPDKKLSKKLLHENLKLIILSDYSAEKISKRSSKRIEELIKKGTGLLMIGGWGSFGGCFGRYDRSPVAKLLPVSLKRNDQVNWAGGLIIKKRIKGPRSARPPARGLEPRAGTAPETPGKPGASSAVNHPIVKNLSFTRSPVICGYNAVRPRRESQILLEARPLLNGKMSPKKIPLLVLGFYGKGRTAAFTSDAAPHWCGGLVDWGVKRVRVKITRKISVDYGSTYQRFWTQLFRYLME